MILQEEFNKILQSFDVDFKDAIKEHPALKEYKYSILGSPLQKTNTLILGDNWGGNNLPSQATMPLTNDILAYHTSSPTYKGVFNIICNVFENDIDRIVTFFNSIVYTNGCFIRTKNESAKYKAIVEVGYTLTQRYLIDVIKLTGAKNILCFGNGTGAITERIAILSGVGEDYYLDRDDVVKKTIPQAYSFYNFKGNISGNEVNVFGFPHASRFNMWEKHLNKKNDVYTNLKEALAN